MPLLPFLSERDKTIASFILPGYLVLVLWAITVFDQTLGLNLWRFGILPRTLSGLWGILFYPLIHNDYGHIASNSLPLLILGALCMYFYRTIAVRVFFIIYFVSGLFIWVFARPDYHIGVSGIIYGLAAFLIISGFIRHNNRLLAISLLILIAYGGIMAGMFPNVNFPNISWEGHLGGFLTGMVCAFIYRRSGPQDDITEMMDDDDDTLPLYDDDELPGYIEEDDSL